MKLLRVFTEPIPFLYGDNIAILQFLSFCINFLHKPKTKFKAELSLSLKSKYSIDVPPSGLKQDGRLLRPEAPFFMIDLEFRVF